MRERLSSIEPVHFSLQPPAYKYRGYRGPWIEDFFYRNWIKNRISSHFTYLPVLFASFFLQAQTHKYLPFEFKRTYGDMLELLQNIDSKKMYFTLLGMYDFPIWEWDIFPKNVLVFAESGEGDVPIPLLKGDGRFLVGKKDILVSFMGSLSGFSDATKVRSRMYDALRDFAYFGQDKNWREIMARSTFSLCPRGIGRTSFRLYEALSLGSIPVYIYDDFPWLPYQDVVDWSELAILLHVKDVGKLPDILSGYSKDRIRAMQQRIEGMYNDFFTYEGVFKNILRMLEGYKSVSDIYEVTRKRQHGTI